jgi:hypothetical protein
MGASECRGGKPPNALRAKGIEEEEVLYGCETWSLTLREEHRLRVFEKRVLGIFRPKRDEKES